jgi:hypothetical protein
MDSALKFFSMTQNASGRGALTAEKKMSYSFNALKAVALAAGILGLNLAAACEPMDCDDYDCGRGGYYGHDHGYRNHDNGYDRDRHHGGDCDSDDGYC